MSRWRCAAEPIGVRGLTLGAEKSEKRPALRSAHLSPSQVQKHGSGRSKPGAVERLRSRAGLAEEVSTQFWHRIRTDVRRQGRSRGSGRRYPGSLARYWCDEPVLTPTKLLLTIVGREKDSSLPAPWTWVLGEGSGATWNLHLEKPKSLGDIWLAIGEGARSDFGTFQI